MITRTLNCGALLLVFVSLLSKSCGTVSEEGSQYVHLRPDSFASRKLGGRSEAGRVEGQEHYQVSSDILPEFAITVQKLGTGQRYLSDGSPLPRYSDLLTEHSSRGGLLLEVVHHFSKHLAADNTHVSTHRRLQEVLLEKDLHKHRKLQGLRERRLKGISENASAEYPLGGATYPNGLYYTSIALGTPSQVFKVDIDTGSNLLWVNCQPCEQCTTSVKQQLSSPFDAGASSTVTRVLCNDTLCTNPDKTVQTRTCTAGDGPCDYVVAYGDGSSSTGTLVQDVLRDPSSTGKSRQLSVPVTFGCGTFQTGNFYNGAAFTYYQGLDGLLGLGRGPFALSSFMADSVKSLLIPNMFSTCLGNAQGKGMLAFGRPHSAPAAIVYTPLKDDHAYYKVTLMRVSVAGHELALSRSAYGNTTGGNTIFDSGTTYTIVPPQVQKAIFASIIRLVGLTPVINNPPDDSIRMGLLCFEATGSMTAESLLLRFPTINLQFQGRGVFMNIPSSVYTFEWLEGVKDYVCARILSSDKLPLPKGLEFMIGDIWMRDFLVEHDLDQQRLGWAPMQCV